MSADIIPEECRRFLARNIDSIAQWEALLLLRAEPGRAWDIATLARHLYVEEGEAGTLLKALAHRKLLEVAKDDHGPLYRYGVADESLAGVIDRSAELYRQYLIPVTNLIHDKAARGIDAFADAFRLRKD